MTNPDREELVKLADAITGHVATLASQPLRMSLITWNVISNDILAAAESLRRLAPPADAGMREALANLLAYTERNECTHESTSRGGSIWTICDDCGRKWADDRGGFKPYVEPAEITAARATLTTPGATTKSDGGQPIHAIKMPEYPYQELDMSGDHYGVTSNYGDYTPVTVRGSTSDPSSTRSDAELFERHTGLKLKITDTTRSEVTVRMLASVLLDCPAGSATAMARALLDQFEIRRKK